MHREEHIRNLKQLLNDADLLPNCMNPITFDGFVAGILSSQKKIAPREWVPLALGNQESLGTLDEVRAQLILDLLVTHFNAVAWNFLEKDAPYKVLVAQSESAEPAWSSWISGFFAVSKLRSTAFDCYDEATSDVKDAFTYLKRLHDFTHERSDMSEEDLKTINQDALSIIPYMILHMYQWLEMNVVPNGPLKRTAWKTIVTPARLKPTYH